jgi:polysaccharide export outer membrane protein
MKVLSWLLMTAGAAGCVLRAPERAGAPPRAPQAAGAAARPAPAAAAAAPSPGPAPQALLQARDALRQEYKIAPQDLLHVVVYQEPDLEREVRVNQAGRVSLPLIGEVAVAGRSAMDAEAAIRRFYEHYLVNPQVSVGIKEYHARQVYVLGEVMKPGAYDIPSDRSLTVVGAVALAGGFTKVASLDKTRVVRHVNGQATTLTVPIKQITAGDKSQDVALSPDDIVYVPQTFF